jgi:hypothetical protein
VRTLKRDYAKFGYRAESKIVTTQLQGSFDDYISHNQHNALGYLMPSLFREKAIGNLNILAILNYVGKTLKYKS